MLPVPDFVGKEGPGRDGRIRGREIGARLRRGILDVPEVGGEEGRSWLELRGACFGLLPLWQGGGFLTMIRGLQACDDFLSQHSAVSLVGIYEMTQLLPVLPTSDTSMLRRAPARWRRWPFAHPHPRPHPERHGMQGASCWGACMQRRPAPRRFR